MNTASQTTLSKGDSGALIGFAISGFAIAAWISTASVIRIIELVRGTDVPVTVDFIDTKVDVALTGGAGTVPVGLETGILTAPQLTPIAIVPGVIGQIVAILTIITVIGCLVLLSRSIIRGHVFSRRNTVLVSTAGITGLVGFAATRFFDNMLANAAVSIVTDNAVDNAVMTIEPFTFVLAAFIIAVIGTAFGVGDKLQRETEGLV